MRIIAGTKRGMKLLSPPPLLHFAKQSGGGSWPITDRVKESLFSVLYKYDLPPLLRSAKQSGEGKIMADLFCGVGSLGLEALSRGAEYVTFVEQDTKIAEVLEKNITKAGFVKESKVIKANAFKFGLLPDGRKYGLIFVDPPYADTKEAGQDSPLGKLLSNASEQLTANGIVVVRTERRTELLNQYGLLQIIERRQWGTMAVTILRKRTDA